MIMPINLLNQMNERGLLDAAKAYLATGCLVSIAENDSGCYDAIFREDGQDFFVEVTLEEGQARTLEDCYCGKCNAILCIHTVAACLKVSEMLHLNQKADGIPQFVLLH